MRKTVMLLAIAALSMSSCKSLRGVETNQISDDYGSPCPHPVYVATVGREASQVGQVKGAVYSSSSLRLSVLLGEAQQKYGADVAITNVRWDLQNGKRRSVVYDVVKCK